MNERIKQLAEQAGCKVMDDGEWYIPSATGLEKIVYTKGIGLEKFAELIVGECIKIALDERVAEEEIDKSDDIEDRCYLRGNNGGVVDAVVAIKQHLGVE